MFLACSGVSSAQDAKSPPQEGKAAPKSATAKESPQDGKAAPPQQGASEATIKEAAGAILTLTAEAKQIDQKVGSMEKSLAEISKSVAEISKSLAPVGALTQPTATTALLNQAGDLAYDRARTLIFVTIGILAVLVVILLVVLLWVLTRRGKDAYPAPKSP